MRVPPARVVKALIAALAVGAVILGGTLSGSTTPPRLATSGSVVGTSATTKPVGESTVVCPAVGGKKPHDVRMTVGAVPSGVPGGVAIPAGSVTGGPLASTSAPADVLGGGTIAEVVDVNAAGKAAPWVLHMASAVAPVGGAYLDGRPHGGPVSGYGTVRCGVPSAEAWFVGFASMVGQHATLVLTNADDIPATVDVKVWGDSGVAESSGLVGIVVAPHSQREVALESAAPDLKLAAAHVSATEGRVASSMIVTAQDGLTPLGYDWLPQTQAPAREAFIPGVPGGEGSRVLYVAVPGDADASLSVHVTTSDGTFVPTGMDAVSVPAGTVAAFDLDPVLAGDPGGVTVTSTVPVAVTVRSGIKSGAAAEFAFEPAAAALAGATLVAGTTVDRGGHTTLVLSAPDGDAAVSVTALNPPGGKPVTTTVNVPAGTTVAFDVAKIMKVGRPVLAVSPAPGSGTVYVGRVVTTTAPSVFGISTGPVVTGPATRTVPAVRHDLRAALP